MDNFKPLFILFCFIGLVFCSDYFHDHQFQVGIYDEVMEISGFDIGMKYLPAEKYDWRWNYPYWNAPRIYNVSIIKDKWHESFNMIRTDNCKLLKEIENCGKLNVYGYKNATFTFNKTNTTYKVGYSYWRGIYTMSNSSSIVLPNEFVNEAEDCLNLNLKVSRNITSYQTNGDGCLLLFGNDLPPMKVRYLSYKLAKPGQYILTNLMLYPVFMAKISMAFMVLSFIYSLFIY